MGQYGNQKSQTPFFEKKTKKKKKWCVVVFLRKCRTNDDNSIIFHIFHFAPFFRVSGAAKRATQKMLRIRVSITKKCKYESEKNIFLVETLCICLIFIRWSFVSSHPCRYQIQMALVANIIYPYIVYGVKHFAIFA